ncbi:PheS-related mystery ligase SrmL [Flindersiella endophytica]
MQPQELERALAIRDLTDPAQGPHACQIIVDDIADNLTAAWHNERRVVRGDRVVSLDDNYENLGFPADAVTRDARYTRYVSAGTVLRSHSSAMIPGALRRLAAETEAATAPRDVLLVCAGICYRRDSIDWQHTGTPHQLDLWRITQKRRMDDRDLTEMIELLVGAALPGARWRTISKVHPYTENGRQIDVWWNGTWVEIGECGLAAPAVLAKAGLDPRVWTGLAMGLGVDRLVMLRKGIPDVRLLRSADPRVAGQLLDLAPYKPVSHMPPVRRDLSIVVGAETDSDAEALGHRVREALGPDAEAAETVTVIGETPYADLPPAARERLGIQPGQRNLLVRLVLRALDRTLTDTEANHLRDRVYAELHEGPIQEWAAPTEPAAI